MPQVFAHSSPPIADGGIVLSRNQLMTLPVTGTGWDDVVDAADNSLAGALVAGDKDDNTDVYAFAKALCVVRQSTNTDFAGYPGEIMDAISAGITPVAGVPPWMVPGAEGSDGPLAFARNLTAWILAADMIGLGNLNPTLNGQFRSFLAGPARYTNISGKSLVNVHEKRPNNWGTHAGAARMAIAAYIDDRADWSRCIQVYRGWLGDRESYDGFGPWGSLSWQNDENDPIGINPVGASKLADGEMRDLDGVLPDDQRRNGDLQWPPPRTNYVYEALQGATLQAIILHHCSRTLMGPALSPFNWSDKALLRAFLWMNDPDRGNFIINKDDYEHVDGWDDGPEPDDYWEIPVMKKVHGSDASALPTITDGFGIGKAFGFTLWFKNATTWLAG